MQNEVIPNNPVLGNTRKPRLLDPYNESYSFFDDAAIARMAEIEAIEDEETRLVQLNFFILRQAPFLPTSELSSFRANLSVLIDVLGLEETKK